MSYNYLCFFLCLYFVFFQIEFFSIFLLLFFLVFFSFGFLIPGTRERSSLRGEGGNKIKSAKYKKKKRKKEREEKRRIDCMMICPNDNHTLIKDGNLRKSFYKTIPNVKLVSFNVLIKYENLS